MIEARKKVLKELEVMAIILVLISIPVFIYWHLPFLTGYIIGFLLCLCLIAIERIKNEN